MDRQIINDLDITGPFRVYDVDREHFIFSRLDPAAPGDLPPDIAILPVLGIHWSWSSRGDVMIIDTEVI